MSFSHIHGFICFTCKALFDLKETEVQIEAQLYYYSKDTT